LQFLENPYWRGGDNKIEIWVAIGTALGVQETG
jgi:hypothetical protein